MAKLLLGFCVTFMALGCVNRLPSETLYAQLGGAAGIEKIVDNFLYQVGESELLIPFFEKTDIDRFHEKLSEQLCEVSDGPCQYTGDPMQEVHAGMAMNNRHFDAVVTALIEAMANAEVPVGAQNQLLAKLAAMHGDVMEGAKTD